jgi:hypothetical protein
VVEFAVPFGIYVDEITVDTLQAMKETKTKKLDNMANEIKRLKMKKSNERVKYYVEFRTIIISSISVVSNEILRSLKTMLGLHSGTALNLRLKRMALTLLRGIFAIYT